MPSWLVILFITIFSFILGALFVRLFLTVHTKPSLYMAFATLSLGTIVTGWLALILAELGLFSVVNLAIAWLVTAALLLFLGLWQRKKSDEPSAKIKRWLSPLIKEKKPSAWLELVILISWAAAALWLYFRPHQYIMGGADAGVYISLGAEIAQEGGFQMIDVGLADLNPDLYGAILRPLPTNPVASSYLFPGFYVTNAEQGAVTPQFYPLHPVWLAVAFALSNSIVDGIYTELLMTGLWMTLAALAIYLTMREIGGRLAAVLTLIALSITALQVWFARYSSTEALTQYLLWTGLWGTVMWLGGRRPNSLWALISGLALGAVFLVRIDVLIMLPIFALLVIALWARGWKHSDWWFTIPFTALVIHSFLHAVLLSAPYFYEHMGFGLRIFLRSWLIPLSALLAGLLFLIFVYFFRGRFAALTRFQKPLKLLIIGLILIAALYGWFIRPVIGQQIVVPDTYSQGTLLLTNHENWLRLGWYLSPFGIWLGVLGMCLLVWHAEWKTAVLVTIGLMFSALYLWDVRANPHQVYVMRRYVPVVLPFFIFAAAYLVGWLLTKAWKGRADEKWVHSASLALGIVVLGIWVMGLGWSARGFISQVDHRGIIDQFMALEQELPPNSVLLFNDPEPVGIGDFWGTPLKYITGHEVYKLRVLEGGITPPLVEMIEFWQNNARSVVWVGDSSWLDSNGFQYRQQSWIIDSQRLESSYEHKPQAIVPVTWSLPLSFVEKR